MASMDDVTTSQAAAERRQMRKTRAIALFVLGAIALLVSWAILTSGEGRADEGTMTAFTVTLLIGLLLVAGGGMLLDKNRRETYSREP